MKLSKAEKAMLSMMDSGVSAYEMLPSLLHAIQREKAKLTPEEREEREARSQKRREEERRRAFIMKGICPECNYKLIRGKKDKKNEYKRVWHCKACNKNHSL